MPTLTPPPARPTADQCRALAVERLASLRTGEHASGGTYASNVIAEAQVWALLAFTAPDDADQVEVVEKVAPLGVIDPECSLCRGQGRWLFTGTRQGADNGPCPNCTTTKDGAEPVTVRVTSPSGRVLDVTEPETSPWPLGVREDAPPVLGRWVDVADERTEDVAA